ncbi:MAG: hypothetical protein M1839_004781 [Geoglossum umbratile]|nr:MAG: hypothetical protein M1839_004781 [Geoglossum umbratile]
MSGVEVAGLILAAFPLCISALEHYRETADVVGFFWQIQREYKKCKQSLSFCQLSFELNLEECLLPLIANEDELRCLLADPGGVAWQDTSLEVKLKERLPKSYGLYLEIIHDIKEITSELEQELAVGKAHFQSKVAQDDTQQLPKKATPDSFMIRKNWEYQAQRLKMSFNKTIREKLFNDLTECNNRLRTLLDSSDRIAVLRSTRHVAKKSAVNKKLWQLWRHASNLYDLLTNSWGCDCRHFHQANLLLRHRTTSDVDFNVVFVFSQQPPELPASSWVWQQANIKMQEDVTSTTITLPVQGPKSQTASLGVASTPQSIPPPQSAPIPQSNPAPPRKSVRRSLLHRLGSWQENRSSP